MRVDTLSETFRRKLESYPRGVLNDMGKTWAHGARATRITEYSYLIQTPQMPWPLRFGWTVIAVTVFTGMIAMYFAR
jgi:hypothetical protein